MLLGTAFSAMTALLAVHGLTTPGMLVPENGTTAFAGLCGRRARLGRRGLYNVRVTSVVVRVAGVNDAGAIARLRSLWSEGEADAAFAERIASWIRTEGDRRTTWLAEADGSAVGLASLFEYRRMPKPGRPDSRWGYVGNVFVREEHRRQGVGSALLSAVVAAADARGHVRLVLSPTERAVPFFRRAGFVVPGEVEGGDRLLVRTGGRQGAYAPPWPAPSSA